MQQFSTEIGSFSKIIPDPAKNDPWQYFSKSPHVHVKMLPQEGSPDLFEPVVMVRQVWMCVRFMHESSLGVPVLHSQCDKYNH